MEGVSGDRAGSERHFREEPVPGHDQRLEVARSTAIPRIDETWAVPDRDAERVAIGRMGHTDRPDVEWPDRDLARDRFDVERRRGEPGLVMECVDAPGQAGRRDHTNVAFWVELPAQVMTHRDEVDEMVGMQVADEYRIDRARFEGRGESRKGPLAEIKDDRCRVGTEQVGGASGPELIGVG